MIDSDNHNEEVRSQQDITETIEEPADGCVTRNVFRNNCNVEEYSKSREYGAEQKKMR